MQDVLDNFFVFEGLDGSGKSTQLSLLGKKLSKLGYKIHVTAEPTDMEIGTLVRKVLRKEKKLNPRALAMLYAADRADHLEAEGGVIEHIKKGEVVLSDRYFYSSLAYQSVQVDSDFVKELNSYPHPKALIYLDAPIDDCLSRIDSRGERELFDKKEFLLEVSKNFEKTFKDLPEEVHFLRLDARKSIEELSKEALTFALTILNG